MTQKWSNWCDGDEAGTNQIGFVLWCEWIQESLTMDENKLWVIVFELFSFTIMPCNNPNMITRVFISPKFDYPKIKRKLG